jgi:hypothetical protein
MIFEFGPFRFDAEQRLLFRGEERVPLVPKAADTLLVLLQNRGKVVEKSELMRLVWPAAPLAFRLPDPWPTTPGVSQRRIGRLDGHGGEGKGAPAAPAAGFVKTGPGLRLLGSQAVREALFWKNEAWR